MELARISVLGQLFLALIYSVVTAETFPATDISDNTQGSFRHRLSIIEDHYIVVYRDQPTAGTNAILDPDIGPTKEQVESSVADLGGTVTYSYNYVLNAFAATLPQNAYDTLIANPNIAYIEPDGIASINGIQTQDLPWGLDRIDQESGLDGVYTYSATGTGVHAYIIDTGISSTHSEFTGRLGNGYNAVTGNVSSPQPWDDCDGHGTHVASTVGGTKYGVAKEVTLHAVRVFDCSGSGPWSDVIAGIDWATGQHIQRKGKKSVANLSLGGSYYRSVNKAVTNMVAAGVVVVVVAGNSFADACNYSPASADNVITVGATNYIDFRAWFSNYGDCVEIFAPGVGILGANYTCNNCSMLLDGTSMASPHVAGVAALYLEKLGGKPAQILAALLENAVDGIVGNAFSTSNKFLQSTLTHNKSGKCRGKGKICQKSFCSLFSLLCCCNGLRCKVGKCR